MAATKTRFSSSSIMGFEPPCLLATGQGCFVMAWFSSFHHTQTTTQHTDNQQPHRQPPNTQTTNQHTDNHPRHKQSANTQTTTQDTDNQSSHRPPKTQTTTQDTDNHPTHRQPPKTQTTTQKAENQSTHWARFRRCADLRVAQDIMIMARSTIRA